MLHHLGIFYYTFPRPDFFLGAFLGGMFSSQTTCFRVTNPGPLCSLKNLLKLIEHISCQNEHFQSTRWIQTQTLDNKSYSKNPMETKYHFLCGQNVWWLIVWFQMLVWWWFTVVESVQKSPYKQIQVSYPSSISDLWRPFKGALHPSKSHHLPRGLPALKGSSLPVPKVSKTSKVFERWWLNRPIW